MRVELPAHLQSLASVGREVRVDVAGPATLGTMLDALELRYPMLRGTIREHQSQRRRAFLRFFACGEDLSHQSMDDPLPQPIIDGDEPLMVIGAIVGG